MLAETTFQDRANRLETLIEDRLGIRGRGLEAKLHRAGRALPGFIRREAGKIVQAHQMLANPKLARQVDPSGLESAFRKCETWLKAVDPKERRKGAVLGLLGTNALNFLIISGGFIAWAVWSGHL